MQTFPNDMSWFATRKFLHELKQRSSDVTGRPVISDITEGVITTRINQMKFRQTQNSFSCSKVIGTSIEKRAPGHV